MFKLAVSITARQTLVSGAPRTENVQDVTDEGRKEVKAPVVSDNEVVLDVTPVGNSNERGLFMRLRLAASRKKAVADGTSLTGRLQKVT